MSTIRIIGGQWRSRKIPVPEYTELRPSTDRIRETLFNWLTPYIHDSTCLDLFSGSGILAFEALSRGAKQVTLLDKNPKIIEHLHKQAEILKTTQTNIIQNDVLKWLTTTPSTIYDMVFLDPPFASKLWLPVIELLIKFKWINNNSIIYIEYPAQEQLNLANLEPLKFQKAGNVCFGLWKLLAN